MATSLSTSGPPSNTWFLCPSEPTTQTASRSVQLFCTNVRRVSLYFTVGRLFHPSKLTLHMGDLMPSVLWHCWLGGRKGIQPVKKWEDDGRWALVSPDGVAPSRMVSVSASVNLPLDHKVQKFSSGTGSPGWSWKKARKTVVVWWWSHGGSGPHLIHGSLGLRPPESSTQTASQSVQPFLQGSLVWQTDRQTDRPRYSLGNNRRHLHM